MFTKSGIEQLHERTHECLDILLKHVAGLPAELLYTALPAFGTPTVWKQIVHILEVEEAWVRGMQSKRRAHWPEQYTQDMETLLLTKQRVQTNTRAYLASLTEEQLNTELTERAEGWVGPLRSPAFILLHIITHSFHHKGQVAAMVRMLGHPTPDTDLQRG